MSQTLPGLPPRRWRACAPGRAAVRATAGVLVGVLAGAWLAAAAQAAGNPARGAAVVADRVQGVCTLCHAVPGQPPAQQGTIGPPLAGVGARLDALALRQRVLAPERFNPDTLMPSYGRIEGLARVAAAQRGRPLLTPGQIDDVVAYLASLR